MMNTKSNKFYELDKLETQNSNLVTAELLLIGKRLSWNAHYVTDELRLTELLHEITHAPEDEIRSTNQRLTLHNFIRQVNLIPNAWEQIETIVGVAVSYLELRVYDCDEFLKTLRAHGYAVNSWMEKVSRWVGHGHRFDSARALTEHRYEPQLHFVNDRADEAAYGPNHFFVHWDAQSVYAKRGWVIGRIAAGRTHAHQCATPQQVHEYLQRLENKAQNQI